MGDEGWLKKNYAEYRKFFYFSDVLWIKGNVVKRYLSDDGEPCIDVESHAINQRREDVMFGYSSLVLPSRDQNYWPVKARLDGKIGMSHHACQD